jgi:hypothetical protein
VNGIFYHGFSHFSFKLLIQQELHAFYAQKCVCANFGQRFKKRLNICCFFLWINHTFKVSKISFSRNCQKNNKRSLLHCIPLIEHLYLSIEHSNGSHSQRLYDSIQGKWLFCMLFNKFKKNGGYQKPKSFFSLVFSIKSIIVRGLLFSMLNALSMEMLSSHQSVFMMLLII